MYPSHITGHYFEWQPRRSGINSTRLVQTIGSQNVRAYSVILPNALDGCSATPTAGLAVWYVIDVQSSNVQISTLGSSFDTQLSVFSGNCSVRFCLAKNDDADGQVTSRVSIIDSRVIGRLLVAVHGVCEIHISQSIWIWLSLWKLSVEYLHREFV